MSKFLLILSVALLLVGCDAVDIEPTFREAETAAKASDINDVHKLMTCLEYAWEPAAVHLSVFPPTADGLQNYVLTIEGNTPVHELKCMWNVIESWKGAQP